MTKYYCLTCGIMVKEKKYVDHYYDTNCMVIETNTHQMWVCNLKPKIVLHTIYFIDNKIIIKK